MQKITPFLWFDSNAEEAINFYVSIFPDSKILNTSYYPEGMPGLGGKLMTATVDIAGQTLMVLNGGPHYQLTPAVSLFVSCEDQAEVDKLWDTLVEGGEPSQCGWLVDKFGLSWQIIPKALGECLGDPDPERAGRAVQAMLKMSKIDVAELERARDGR